jgi:probable rRNA maturation factor
MFNFYGQVNCVRSRKRKLKEVLNAILSEHSKTQGNIDYIFVSDKELLEINIKSLKHDFYTDIITFDYTEGQKLTGEIYISVDRVKENSKEFNQMFHVELARVIFHGVLHMVGYRDKTKTEKIEMRKQEDLYIKRYLKLFHVEQ